MSTAAIQKNLPWKTVWITGASTGIGREIALLLARAGLTVAASARRADMLTGLHPNIHAYPLDVTDGAAVAQTVAKIEHELAPIDLAIMAAGVYQPISADQIDPAVFSSLMGVNYQGVVNALASLLPVMRVRGRGHVAWIASVAGYRGLPKAAAYGPTKAALINLAECLKPELQRQGITVSVVNPGFVATPMTKDNDFPMPFLMQPNEAASRTIAGLAKGKFEVAFPTRFVAILKFARCLPYGLYFWIISKAILK
ncbi:MAG: SDR family NAD(P)-dependent oxidoreductase [Alphaproteobacteria bacterium]|nr:SDR family NAD(P)-dependent oxidoreductase [Alphaproteobacteria bacterium]